MSGRLVSLIAAVIAILPMAARAHISVISGPAFANTSQEITFGVGHGCSGVDTYSVRIEIPASVTSVRAETSDFGRATLEKDAAGLVTAVTWQKPDANLLASDDNYYKLTMRIKVPNQPFTTALFPAHQTCKAPDGTTTVVHWIATTSGGSDEPAPVLKVLPARVPGWNKVTVPLAITELSGYFGDALIVWKGSSAYSPNPNTVALIATTPGVTPLSAVAANDEVWVKY